MKIRPEIARRYWLLASIEESRKQFQDEGFRVTTDATIEGFKVDLLAESDKRRIFVEFKTPGRSDRIAEAIEVRNRVVHQLGGEFRLVWVTPPRERDIEISGLDEKLLDRLVDDIPSELDSLSTHTSIEAVGDVFVSAIVLRENYVEVEGEATVEVSLNYGSEGDRARGDGATHSDAYPLRFKVILDATLQIVEVQEWVVDTSDFYD
jgi:hypothetical protein